MSMACSITRGVIVVGVLMVGACGSGESSTETAAGQVMGADPAVSPYDGPMTAVNADAAADGQPLSVAELALECDGEPYGGGSVDYADGRAEVQDSPSAALANMLEFPTMPWPELPTHGYRQERTDEGRALLSFDVEARTRIAVVVADGIEDYLDNDGWGVESWARCDPSELSGDVTDQLGIGVWEDETGHRVAVTEILSFQGPEHCDDQDVTFLDLTPGDPSLKYVRVTDDRYSGYLTTTFATLDALPDGATDTGYSRHSRSLWLGSSPAAAYLVNDSDPNDIERWPAETEPITCA